MFSPQDIETLTSSSKQGNPYVVIKENVFEDIIDDVFEEVQTLRRHMRPAKMGRGETLWEDDHIRGDNLCWVTPDVCKELGLRTIELYVHRLLLECDVMKDELGLTYEYNMQFAIYPGQGEGYNRHRDSFPRQMVPCNPNDGEAETSRQLTCLLYLNQEWMHEDGGQLRLFTEPGVTIHGAGEGFNFWGVSGYDINPSFGRMVVFRSELVDHAVMPCYRERSALTFWINGTGPVGKKNVSHPETETECGEDSGWQ